MTVMTVGIDLAKSVFQVHGVDRDGRAVLRRRLTRGRLLDFFAKLPPCAGSGSRRARVPTTGRGVSPRSGTIVSW